MKQKILILILSLLLATQSLGLISTAIDGAKMRTGPSNSYSVKMDLPKYYPLKVVAKSGKWRQVVDWQRAKGWIHVSTLSNQRTAIVRKLRVNLRTGPGRGYRRVVHLYKGYTLKILKHRGSWYKVQVVDPPSKKTGWVASWLIWG